MPDAQKTKVFRDVGPFSLNVTDDLLLREGVEIALRPKALALLKRFFQHPGRLFSRAELKQAVWPGIHVTNSSVDQEIAEIRRQLGPLAEGLIQNRRGKGWFLAASVSERIESPAPEATATALPAPVKSRWQRLLMASAIAAALPIAAVWVTWQLPQQVPRVTGFRQLTFDGHGKNGPVVTDGKFIYFRSEAGPVMQVPVSGGDPAPANVPPAFGFPADFASGAGILLVGDEPRSQISLWRPESGSRISPTAVSGHAGISPDGQHLAVAVDGALRIERRGGRPITLVSVPGSPDWPRWSPDGSRIRFTLWDRRADVQSLWEVNRDGSGLHKLPLAIPNDGQVCCGIWTRDGKYFVFQDRTPDTDGGRLWIAGATRRARSDTPRQLLSWPMIFRSDGAVVSPDNAHLIVIGRSERVECWRYDTQLATYSPFWGGAAVSDVSFSLDGKFAAYCDVRLHTVWTADSAGGRRVQLTPESWEAYQPHWSPDGKQVAFMARQPGRPWRIYVGPRGGGPAREVEPGGSAEQGVPSWSGDGRLLVYGDRQYQTAREKMSIHLIDVYTGTQTPLPGSEGKWSPRWSPDGRCIVAHASDFSSLYLYECRSQKWAPLVTTRVIGNSVWSPDSQYVYYATAVEQGFAIHRLSIGDRKQARLFSSPQGGGSWVGVTPDGSPLVLRVIGNEDIYSLDWVLP